ncbi:MAG: flagellin [Acidimicrobiales bacterium]|jgi:flagellin
MGLDIVTNTMATEASNDISTNQMNMQSSLEKLSSGYQINSPADDASGYVISQHLQSQIGGFQQAQANTQSAINVVQTADGALNEVSTILQRINTLAVQSANTSATDPTAQQAAQAEVSQALTSISNIAATTVYGDNQLLVNGTSSTVDYTFQVGNDNTSNSQVSFSVTALNLANLGLVQNSLTLPASSLNISSAVGNVSAGAQVLQATAATGAAVTGGTFTVTGGSFAVSASSFTISVDGGTAVTVTTAAGTTTLAALTTLLTTDLSNAGYSATAVTVTSNATGITITDATTGGAASVVLAGGASSGLAQIGLSATSNTGTDASVSLDGGTATSVTTAQNTAGGTVNVTNGQGQSVALTLSGGLSTGTIHATQSYSNLNAVNFSVTSSTAIATVANAIQTVSSMGGTLGAVQNELSDISDNESVMVQNLQSSNSQIEDTNMASQMVSFTQDQTLVQAGISMLAQANQIPQYVLKLLG